MDVESQQKCYDFYHGESSTALFVEANEGDGWLTPKDYSFLMQENKAKTTEGGLIALFTSRREKNWKYLRPVSFEEKIELNMIEKFIHTSIGKEFIHSIKFSRRETET